MHSARFAHSRLLAYQVILEALVRGDAVDAARALQLAPAGEPEHIIALLDRFAAMATGLGQLGSH